MRGVEIIGTEACHDIRIRMLFTSECTLLTKSMCYIVVSKSAIHVFVEKIRIMQENHDFISQGEQS